MAAWELANWQNLYRNYDDYITGTKICNWLCTKMYAAMLKFSEAHHTDGYRILFLGLIGLAQRHFAYLACMYTAYVLERGKFDQIE